MNDNPEPDLAAHPDLAAAIRQARVENAERAEAIADLREIEMGRLALLESALKPVVEQAPPGVDMFDLALAQGAHPRLFVDMIAFIDMAHDRRTYRFHQDTRNGRVLIAENQSVDAIAAAVARYVARRLIERERALASDRRDAEADAPPASGAIAAGDWAPPRRRFVRRLADFLSLFLMMLGSMTLALLIGLGGYLAWTMQLRDLWAQWTAAPPF